MPLDKKFYWRNMIDVALPEFPEITNATRTNPNNYADARSFLGKFPTDEEYKKHREESLATPLP
jgi:hypothetical protein